MFTGRMYSPAPSVSAPRVPLYLQGTSPGLFQPRDPNLHAMLAAGIDPDTADLIFSALANGVMSEEDFEELLGGKLSDADFNRILYGDSNAQVPAGDDYPFGPARLSGFLGQDDGDFEIDTTMAPDTGTLVEPTMPPIVLAPSASTLDLSTTMAPDTGGLVPSSTPTFTVSPQDEAAMEVAQQGGTLAQQQAASAAVAGGAQMTTAVANALKSVVSAAGVAPKVTMPSLATSFSSLLSSSTLIKGIPDIVTLGGGFLLVMMVVGKKR